MLFLASVVAVVLLLTGVALAADVICKANKACKGTPEADTITGSPGNDNINPFNGNDVVKGEGGDDYVHHSYGDDTIIGGPGKDTLRGGFGNDKIYANDNERDLVDCAYLEERGDGTNNGYDDAWVDSKDVVVDCKNVSVSRQ
jgi:Ca2+-binding RTX toxin-like protein